MKKILFITAFVPSPIAAGDKITQEFISDLSKENLVDLIYYKYDWNNDYIIPNKNVKVLRIVKNSIFKKIFNILLFPFIHPLFSVRFNWSILNFIKKKIRVEQYDLVIFDHSQTFLFGKFLKDIPKLFIAHDVIVQRVSRTSNFFITYLTEYSEKYVLSALKSKVFTFSLKDAKILKETYNIDAGVTNFYIDREILKVYPQNIENSIIFIGKWARADNSDGLYWFLKEVHPLLPRNIIIKIIGVGLSEKIQKIVCKYDNIVYLGFVDNPYIEISNAKVVASPLFTGAGVKVKVIEALACGTPVIGTPIAFEGIPSMYSDFMIEAINAEQFAEKILDLDFSLEQRAAMKLHFINTYISGTILSYTHDLLIPKCQIKL